MTRSEVIDIIEEFGITISKLAEVHPTMSTKEAAKFLGRSDRWVRLNADRFGPKRVDKRGTYRLDTKKILNYQLKS